MRNKKNNMKIIIITIAVNIFVIIAAISIYKIFTGKGNFSSNLVNNPLENMRTPPELIISKETGIIKLDLKNVYSIAADLNNKINVEGFSGCCNPSYIALRNNGDIITSEKGIPRVKSYDPSGKFKGVISGTESFDRNTLVIPVACDHEGNILILDTINRRILIFN